MFDEVKEWILSRWFQPYLWTICFFAWYQLYFTAFFGLVISCSWCLSILLSFPFVALWLLSVGSLYKCLYTRPPLIPQDYSVPQQVFDLLTRQDQQDFRASETNFSTSSSSASSCESGDEHVQFKPRVQKRSQWEVFYRELTNLAEQRNLSVRTLPMTFRRETIQCPTVCTRCLIVKPDRTHHCRRCGKCIARMDHHCPAIGKCVHLANHKFFLIFLMYATLLCVYAFITMLPLLINAFSRFYTFRPPKDDNHDIFTIPFTFSAMGCIHSLIFPIILIWFQWTLWQDLMKNQTTLEDTEFDVEQFPPEHVNKYDLGSRQRNVESIFGPNKWTWFMPIQTTKLVI